MPSSEQQSSQTDKTNLWILWITSVIDLTFHFWLFQSNLAISPTVKKWIKQKSIYLAAPLACHKENTILVLTRFCNRAQVEATLYTCLNTYILRKHIWFRLNFGLQSKHINIQCLTMIFKIFSKEDYCAITKIFWLGGSFLCKLFLRVPRRN